MAEIKILFTRSESFGSRFLQWAQRCHWSHVEVLFDDCIIGARSCGVKKFSLDEMYPDHTIGTVKCSDAKYKKFREFLESKIGEKYDWQAYLGFILYTRAEEEDKWFCSELIQEAMKHAGIEVINNTDSMWCMPRDFWISTKVKTK